MKKMNIIAGILSLLIAGMLFYGGIMANKNITTFERRIVADGKYYGEPVYLREMITPNDVAVQEFVKKYRLDEGTDEQKIIRIFDLFEKPGVYFYTDDKSIVFKNNNIEMGGFDDVWEYPKFILAEFENKGRVSVDCETGSMLITTLLIASGVNAREVIGTVSIPNKGIYGHGWTEVKIRKGNSGKSKWYLCESTLGHRLRKFILIPDKYKAYYSFTDKDIKMTSGANIESIPPMLDQNGVKELRNFLDSL